ncbi:MAG: hypothetical protein HY877_09000 [Deltaproteobacteria bacterium]|nr:hypothetical protein [Deltaproteobacteria bacterium]
MAEIDAPRDAGAGPVRSTAEGDGAVPPSPPAPVVDFFADGATSGAYWSPIQPSIPQLEETSHTFQNNAVAAFQRGEFQQASNLANASIGTLQQALLQNPNEEVTLRIQGNAIASAELEAVATARLGEIDNALRQFSVRVNTIFPPPQLPRQVRAWWRLAKVLMSLGMKNVADSAYQRALGSAHVTGAIGVMDAILVDQAARLFANGYDAEARVVIISLIGFRDRTRTGGPWGRAGDPNAARILLSQLEQARLTLPNPESGRWTPTDTPVIINGRLRGIAADLLMRGFPQFAAEILSRLARFQVDKRQPQASDTINAACAAQEDIIRVVGDKSVGDQPAVAEARTAQAKLRALQANIQQEETPLRVSDHTRSSAKGDAAMSEGTRRLANHDPSARDFFRRAADAYAEVGNFWTDVGRQDLAIEARTSQTIANVAAENNLPSSITINLDIFLDVVNRLFPDRTLPQELQTARAQRADAVLKLGRKAFAAGNPRFAIAAMAKAASLYGYFKFYRPQISALAETAQVYLFMRDMGNATKFFRQAFDLVQTQTTDPNSVKRAVLDPAQKAIDAFSHTNPDHASLAMAQLVVNRVRGWFQEIPVQPPPVKPVPQASPVTPILPIRQAPPETPATTGQTFYEGKMFNQAMGQFATEAMAAATSGDYATAISAMVQSVRAGIRADIVLVLAENPRKGLFRKKNSNPGRARSALGNFDQFLAQYPGLKSAALNALRYMLSSPDVANRLDAIEADYKLPRMQVAGEFIETKAPLRPPSGKPPSSAGSASAAKKGGTSGEPDGKVGGAKVQRVAIAEGALQITGLLGTAYVAAALNMRGWLSDDGFTAAGLGGAGIAFYAFPIVGPLSALLARQVADPLARLADEASSRVGIENPYGRLGVRIAGEGAGGYAFFVFVKKILEMRYGKKAVHAFDEAARALLKRGMFAIGDAGLATEAKIATAGSRILTGGKVFLVGARASTGALATGGISLLAMFLGGGLDAKDQIYIAMGADREERLQNLIDWAEENLSIHWDGRKDAGRDERSKKFLTLYFSYKTEFKNAQGKPSEGLASVTKSFVTEFPELTQIFQTT